MVVSAVRSAEKDTSGEIRIHIDKTCHGDVMERAKKVFGKLGMHKTAQRNGVLIYMAIESKVFAILGDKGINDVVPENFWQDVSDMMASEFRQGHFTEGLTAASLAVGKKLKEFFPYQSDDVNELPDDISFNTKDQ